MRAKRALRPFHNYTVRWLHEQQDDDRARGRIRSMSTAATAPARIAPRELLERLTAREPVTILDVREEADWPIKPPVGTLVHMPASDAAARAADLAHELSEPVVVVCNRGLTAQRVSEALAAAGMPSYVLDRGMRGWIGALRAVEVASPVPGLSVVQVQRPARGCLSYVIAAGGRALVVDPAPDATFYTEVAASMASRVVEVLDTHLHADHLSGARDLAAAAGARLRLPAAALERGVAYADRVHPLGDGEAIDLGGPDVFALALPGHTTDMTGLLLGDAMLVSGDSLFADGVARPDLQRGDPDGARAMARVLYATLHERVLSLPGETVLLPGHTHPGIGDGAVAPTLAEARAAIGELALPDADSFAEALLADMPPRPANYESVIAVNSGMLAFDAELEVGGNSCSTGAAA